MNLTQEHVQQVVKSKTVDTIEKTTNCKRDLKHLKTFYLKKKKHEALQIIDSNVNITILTSSSPHVNMSDMYRNSIVNEAILDMIDTFFTKGFAYSECHIVCSLYYDLLDEIRNGMLENMRCRLFFGKTNLTRLENLRHFKKVLHLIGVCSSLEPNKR